MIRSVSPTEVVETARASLTLSAGAQADRAYLAASLRRIAGFLCPCSPKTLLHAMLESHSGLANEDFPMLVETSIEALVAAGDFLELADVTTLDEAVKSTWVFAAPPSFVQRPSGGVFLLGLSSDEPAPLPDDLLKRVELRGVIRTIDPMDGEDLVDLLTGLGLRQLSMTAWLRHPKIEAAHALLALLDSKLAAAGPAGDIENLRVLDKARPSRSYRNRWSLPGALTGRYIARRPQAYGADLWVYVDLLRGQPMKFIDFPPAGSRWRGCDIAWRAQMAMDALSGDVQLYRRQQTPHGVTVDLFSPIPDWARRRLALVGEEADPVSSLLSYLVPAGEAAAEEKFLQDLLFLMPDPAWS